MRRLLSTYVRRHKPPNFCNVYPAVAEIAFKLQKRTIEITEPVTRLDGGTPPGYNTPHARTAFSAIVSKSLNK